MGRSKDVDARIEALGSLPTIGDMAKRFDVTLRFLRFYEEQGVLQPIRLGNTRLYDEAQQARVSSIVRARMLGASVAEIRDTVGSERQAAATKMLADRIEALRQRRNLIDEEISRLEAQSAREASKKPRQSRRP